MTAADRFAIDIDQDVCTGHGRCYTVHPDLFQPDAEGFPVLGAPSHGPAQLPAARDAERNCPEHAIGIRAAPLDDVAG